VYSLEGDEWQNITIYYYFLSTYDFIIDYYMSSIYSTPTHHHSGTFYFKICHNGQSYEFAFKGELEQINGKILYQLRQSDKINIARKKVMLLDENKEVCQIDLNRFDRYFRNLVTVENLGINCINNCQEIGKIFGLEYKFVQIIQLMPFTKQVSNPSEMIINDWYTFKSEKD